MTGDRDEKQTTYVNLKMLDKKGVCTDIHAFNKDLVQKSKTEKTHVKL